jgi:ferrochelatase
VAQAAGLADDLWQIAYQSRFEDSQKWLQPTLTTSLKRLVHSGVQNIYVIAPGFAVDNIETLDEIEYCANKYVCDLSRQRSNRGYSGGSGGSGDNDQATLTYIPALNDSDEHVRALAAILGA